MNLPALKTRFRSSLPSFFTEDSTDRFDSFMDNFFNDFHRNFYDNGHCKWEDDSTLVYKLDVPGFNKDNLNVEVAEGVLTISGESEIRKENAYGKSKILKRYDVGDIENADAVIRDGILTVKLEYPKKEVKVKKIEVSDGEK